MWHKTQWHLVSGMPRVCCLRTLQTRTARPHNPQHPGCAWGLRVISCIESTSEENDPPISDHFGALFGKMTRHHAGPSQPRRRCSLLPTTKPAQRPSTRGHSAGPLTSRLRCRATIHGAENQEQTTSSCTAAAAEIATPLKHRTRPRGQSTSSSPAPTSIVAMIL